MKISQKIVFLKLLNTVGLSLIFGLLFFDFDFKTEIASGIFFIFTSLNLYIGYKIQKHLSKSLFNLDFQIKNTFEFLTYKRNQLKMETLNNKNDEVGVISLTINDYVERDYIRRLCFFSKRNR